jgi:hypothetical protein
MALREPFPGFPPPLTTRPEGLLSMLGLQTNGSYPQHLAYENLSPTLDLLNWYLESRAEIQSLATFAQGGVIGAFQSLYTVPPQEVWILLAFTIQPTNIAATTAIQLCRARSNDSLSRLALGPPEQVLVTRFPLVRSDEATRYLVIRPSVQIGYQNVEAPNGGNLFNACLRFVRCTI